MLKIVTKELCFGGATTSIVGENVKTKSSGGRTCGGGSSNGNSSVVGFRRFNLS
jgi:hypothetical protein